MASPRHLFADACHGSGFFLFFWVFFFSARLRACSTKVLVLWNYLTPTSYQRERVTKFELKMLTPKTKNLPNNRNNRKQKKPSVKHTHKTKTQNKKQRMEPQNKNKRNERMQKKTYRLWLEVFQYFVEIEIPASGEWWQRRKKKYKKKYGFKVVSGFKAKMEFNLIFFLNFCGRENYLKKILV